jgi:hypothetical protein
MALSQNQYRDAIAAIRSATAEITGRNPRTEGYLSILLGLALVRSGNRQAGLEKCREALTAAQEMDDPGELLDARLALLEALLTTRDSAGAQNVFHDMERALESYPESRWRALVLMAHSDRLYAGRANEALGQLDALWGHQTLLIYLKRPDVRQFWPLLPANFAYH